MIDITFSKNQRIFGVLFVIGSFIFGYLCIFLADIYNPLFILGTCGSVYMMVMGMIIAFDEFEEKEEGEVR